MSYQFPYPPPQRARRRPGSVTFAAILMLLIAGLAVLQAVLSLTTMNQVVNAFRERAAQTDAGATEVDAVAAAIRGLSIAMALLALLFAALLVGLAVGVLRGSRAARVMTWIVCGLGVLCGCCGVLGSVSQATVTSLSSGDVDAQTAEQLGRALREAYPGWWLATGGGLSGLQLLGYIAIAVLLALPAANAFFRIPAPPAGQPPPE